MMRELLDRLAEVDSRIRRGRAVNVNDRQSKDEVIALASYYFREVRPRLVTALGESPEVLQFDDGWQRAIRLAHGNNSRSSYRSLFKSLTKRAAELNIALLSRPQAATASSAPTHTPPEQQLISTLEATVPTAAASYRQALADLASAERISYRGTAADLREALRDTLDHLAPDADVMAESNFRVEPGQTRPSMKQKVRFILRSRGRPSAERQAAEKSIELAESLSGAVARAVYNRASLATHVEASRQQVLKLKRYVDTVLFDLLEIAE